MPPTPAEAAAAEARPRRLAAGEWWPKVYPNQRSGVSINSDECTLADAWLAANPTDDAVPLSQQHQE